VNWITSPFIAALVFTAAPAFAQTDRGLSDCAAVNETERGACEARNNAVKYCRPETDEARFAACVAEAVKTPPSLRKPGFAMTGARKQAPQAGPKKDQR